MVTLAATSEAPMFVSRDVFDALKRGGIIQSTLPICREAVYPTPHTPLDRIRLEARAREFLEGQLLKEARNCGATILSGDDRITAWQIHDDGNEVRILASANAARLAKPLGSCLRALS